MRRLRLMAMVPSSGSSRPASRLSNVDLPAPLGPTSPMRSCSSIWKLTPAKIRSAPNDFPTCMTLTMGIYLSYYACCKLFLVYHTIVSLGQPYPHRLKGVHEANWPIVFLIEQELWYTEGTKSL